MNDLNITQEELDSLTEDERERVLKLINKFRKRKPEQKKELKEERPKGREKSRKRIQMPDEKPQARNTHGKGRTEPRNPDNIIQDTRGRGRKSRRGTGAGKVMARTESVQLGRKNKFEEMSARNAAKRDTDIDKLLWKDRVATERPEEYEYAEVQCLRCRKWFDVDPSLVFVDPEEGVRFYCNDCAGPSE